MENSKSIPTKEKNPNGLHQRYYIQKIVGAKFAGFDFLQQEVYEPVLQDADKDAEYFVMRLDEGGSDYQHIQACRIGVNAYADAIEHHLPELAKDLRERYPLLPYGKSH